VERENFEDDKILMYN